MNQAMNQAKSQSTSPSKPTLTYCTNVHPGETLAEVRHSLEQYTVAVRSTLNGLTADVDATFPVGLYLSAATARELTDAATLASFSAFLRERGLRIATLNCFPFGGFHGESVKLEVYRPTWLERRRFDFTLTAAHVLAQLLPEGAVGPISTVAGSCKRFEDGGDAAVRIAVNLAALAAELARLRAETGREIVLCLEPEPFTTLETSAEVVAFYEEQLFATRGRAAFVAAGGSAANAEAELRRHLGICFDTCHQAVEFEEPAGAVRRIFGAGIRIGKMQLSSALALREPAASPKALGELRRFIEPRYLHQTFCRTRAGRIDRFLDLPEALAEPGSTADAAAELRVHYHVPIDRAELGLLGTTRDDLVAAAVMSRSLHATPLYEVETYTFPYLPRTRPDVGELVAALGAELRFAAATLGG